MKQESEISHARERLSWAETGICLAYEIARCRSQDPYLIVGAFAKKHDGSVVLGYNGAPCGIDIDWSNRDERRKRVLHAESNTLNFCQPGEVEMLCVTHLPCSECIKVIAQKKIKKVYFSEFAAGYDARLTIKLAGEFGIYIRQIPFDSIPKLK